MKIDIAIPTLNRPGKLSECIQSLRRAYIDGVNVWILVSNSEELGRYAELYASTDWIRIALTDYSKVSICWNTFVAQSIERGSDAVLFLCDDTTLDADCLLNAATTLQVNWPNLCGVVGLNVTNYPPSWPEAITQYGFRLVGNTFHTRFYPPGQAYCPEYYRFYVDTEMGEWAKESKCFAFDPHATMQHWHPDAPGGILDDTHHANRGEKQVWDNEIWKARQAAGYLWGRNKGLVNIH